MARALEKDPDRIAAELRERRSLLERSSETYLAALEAAQRLAVQAEDVDFEEASRP